MTRSWCRWGTTVGLGLALSACGEDPPGGEGASGSSDSTGDGVVASSSGAVADDTEDGTSGAGPEPTGSSGGDDEPSTTTGDPVDLDDVLRLNHAQVKGTHNSYHLEPPLPLHPSHEYTQPPLPEQLDEHGVRAFELDVHRDLDGTISVYHILGIDQSTSCGTLEVCLSQIKAWSDLNPDHLPVIVWMELKDSTGGLAIDSLEHLQAIEDVVTGVFPPAQLLTPDDVQGEHPTLRERLQAEGWPTLGETRGQVLVTILDSDARAELYSDGFSTLEGRPLFIRASVDQFDQPWAAIAKLGTGDADGVAAAHAANIIVASNICNADESDEDCFATRQEAMDAGIHMLKDDYPAQVPDREYWLEFADGNPARCNPVTAPPECTSEALEDLP